MAAEEFVDEEDYLTFMNGFRVQVRATLFAVVEPVTVTVMIL